MEEQSSSSSPSTSSPPSSSSLVNDNTPHSSAADTAETSHNNDLPSDFESLQSKHAEAEENLALLRQKMDDCVDQNTRLRREMAKIMSERDSLKDQIGSLEMSLREKEEDLLKKLDLEEGFKKEVEDFKERVQKLESEREGMNLMMEESLESLNSTKDCLCRVLKGIEEENDENSDEEKEGIDLKSREFLEDVRMVSRLAIKVETRIERYKDSKKKEKKELENSLISLTEENRDINKLLRIAILQKESMEKKLKGRVPLLPFGLQKVGFGFMMGANTNEPTSESTGVNIGAKSDSSECEEETISLVSYIYLLLSYF